MHCELFKNIHVVKLERLAMPSNDPLKLNNVINTFFNKSKHNIISH